MAGAQITDRDRRLLSFLAEHRIVLAAHVQALLGMTADATRTRLRRLSRAGLVRSDRVFYGEPASHQITRRGLAAIGSELAPPRRLDLAGYRHDVGLAWLWVAAQAGTFGPLKQIVSERQMRSNDGAAQATGERPQFGIKLGGVGPGGRERLHYPDLVLATSSGHCIAVELELTVKGRARRERILCSYGADQRIDAVLYLVRDRAAAEAIRGSAARLGLSGMILVQRFRWGGEAPGAAAGRDLVRTPSRSNEVAR